MVYTYYNDFIGGKCIKKIDSIFSVKSKIVGSFASFKCEQRLAKKSTRRCLFFFLLEVMNCKSLTLCQFHQHLRAHFSYKILTPKPERN